MTGAILDELHELSGLTVEEVIGVDAPVDRLLALIRELLRHFPDHAHVAGEFAEAWSGNRPDDGVIIHAWLLELAGEPVGFTVFHTNVRRGIVLQHFVGMDVDARPDLPLRWVKYLADAVFATGIRDCEEHGRPLLASMGENHPEHARTWERFGYRSIDIDYLEPLHGRHWREYEERSFFPMTTQIRLTDAGQELPFGEVVEAAASAFLLDHYQLPEDEPTVVHTLERARSLS